MTALPLTTDAGAPGTRTEEVSFRARLAALESSYCDLWRSCSTDTPVLGEPVSRWRQLSNSRRTRHLIGEIAYRVEEYPQGATEQAQWRAVLQERVRRFGLDRFAWPEGYRDLLLADEFWTSTVEFVRAARRFAPSISPEDLFQALRNVWIMNSAQMMLDLEVELTPPVFAYSMLYPWTDNYIDDPTIGAETKRGFNRRLARRLEGGPVAAANKHEAEVFELVATIERALPRERHGEAYSSIQAIQRAQIESLRQHGPGLSSDELLELSIRKGGASVLPDAYLVSGRIDPDEEQFMFGYGVFLQLLDDLQDVEVDLAAGHRTVFTEASGNGMLDEPVARLHALIHRCLDGNRRFAGEAYDDRRDLIRRNCVALLVGAVAAQPSRFSIGFRRSLERRWPLRFGAIRSLRRYSRKRFSQLRRVLKRRFGTDSPLDLLCRSSADIGDRTPPRGGAL